MLDKGSADDSIDCSTDGSALKISKGNAGSRVGSRLGSRVGCTELHSSLVVGGSVGDHVSSPRSGALVARRPLGLRVGHELGRCDGVNVEDCVGCRVGESDGLRDEYSWRDVGESVGTPEGT